MTEAKVRPSEWIECIRDEMHDIGICLANIEWNLRQIEEADE